MSAYKELIIAGRFGDRIQKLFQRGRMKIVFRLLDNEKLVRGDAQAYNQAQSARKAGAHGFQRNVIITVDLNTQRLLPIIAWHDINIYAQDSIAEFAEPNALWKSACRQTHYSRNEVVIHRLHRERALFARLLPIESYASPR